MVTKEVRTFKDIQDAIIELAKIDPTNSAEVDKVQRKVNMFYARVAAKRAYRWAGNTQHIQLKGKYSTGTITATNGSSTIAGVSTVWDETLHLGWKMLIGSDPYPFKVTRVASNTSIEIDASYTGTTESGISYILFKDEYAMFPDLESIRKIHIPGTAIRQKALPVSPEELNDRRQQYPFRSGTPEIYTLDGKGYYNETTWASFQINVDYWETPFSEKPLDEVLHVWPGQLTADRNITVRYSKKVESLLLDADEPWMPIHHRMVLVYGALYTEFLQDRDVQPKLLQTL